MAEAAATPLDPARGALGFTVLRVPFFLEPDYDNASAETNRERLIRKWGGKEGWERQKRQHRLSPAR